MSYSTEPGARQTAPRTAPTKADSGTVFQKVIRLTPALGEHNEEVYEGLLGYTARELADLERRGVI